MIVDAAGSDGTFDFHRLFGDSDGNGTVDSNDFADFGSIFGATTGAPSFLPAFDYDNNGTVDSIDLAQFGGRFGITI
jgi:hypothetical protein